MSKIRLFKRAIFASQLGTGCADRDKPFRESHMDQSLHLRRMANLRTPTGLSEDAVKDISAAATTLLADVFALYMKTKNFHWHMSGANFRDYHLLLDEHSEQLLAMTDPLAERVRKLGGSTLRSVGDIAKRQRIADNDADFVHPHEMLAELRDDNAGIAAALRSLHGVCDEHADIATASLLENWIDEAEQRVWFLFEILRDTNR
jgi:starvation-inducible DNA-binding protein